MRESVEDNIDPEGIGFRRELEEELIILSLPLPSVSDVCVVCHQHHDSTRLIPNAPEVWHRAFGSPLGRTAATASTPKLDGRNLWYVVHVVEC